MTPRFLSLGDRAFTVEFAPEIDAQARAEVARLDTAIASARGDGLLNAVIAVVPTFRSLTVHYDPLVAGRAELEQASLNWRDRPRRRPRPSRRTGASRCFTVAMAAPIFPCWPRPPASRWNAGDRLPLGQPAAGEPFAYSDPPADTDDPTRVVLGPQEDHFESQALSDLCAGRYTDTDKVDRMGMRLDGPRLAHRAPKLAQIASDGTVPGSVQVPGNGRPIVLLADGQTVGDYPKIATVISADLPRLARRTPGDRIRFVAVEVDKGEEQYRKQIATLRTMAKQARPASRTVGVDLRSLYASNLISGMVDMNRPGHFPGNVD